eukprot:Em0253g1a
MDFAELAKSFQDAISAIDAAGQVLDLRLVPLLQAISQNLRHLLKDFRSRRPVATPRVASAAATAVHITPTSPATMEGSPIVTATRFFQALNSDDLNDAINSPADTNITPARNDSPTASNSFEATPSSVHEPMIDRPSQRGCLLHTSGTKHEDLVNLCEQNITRLFQRLVQQCADQYMCQLCSDHHEFEVTHTRLKDCSHIASRSFADSVMLAGPYPNTLKRVAYNLVSVQECVDQSSHLPIYASGDRPVFGHIGNVAEAVNYFDGDGGSINVDRFPGLRRYFEVSGVPIHSVRDRQADMWKSVAGPLRARLWPYCVKWRKACAERRGVFQYGLEMGVEELMPWVLKDRLADRGSSHSVRCGAVIMSWDRHDVVMLHAGVGVYDPQVYDGRNIGRFINQGGLLDRIKALVGNSMPSLRLQKSQLALYSCTCSVLVSTGTKQCNLWVPAMVLALENLSCSKHTASAMRGGQDTIVTARKAIKISNDQAIELLANYGLSYWFVFAVNNHVRLGHDSVLVKGIFWLLFSKYS